MILNLHLNGIRCKLTKSGRIFKLKKDFHLTLKQHEF